MHPRSEQDARRVCTQATADGGTTSQLLSAVGLAGLPCQLAAQGRVPPVATARALEVGLPIPATVIIIIPVIVVIVKVLALHSVAQRGTAWHHMVRHGMGWHGATAGATRLAGRVVHWQGAGTMKCGVVWAGSMALAARRSPAMPSPTSCCAGDAGSPRSGTSPPPPACSLLHASRH